jgi:hypothetical protein
MKSLHNNDTSSFLSIIELMLAGAWYFQFKILASWGDKNQRIGSSGCIKALKGWFHERMGCFLGGYLTLKKKKNRDYILKHGVWLFDALNDDYQPWEPAWYLMGRGGLEADPSNRPTLGSLRLKFPCK